MTLHPLANPAVPVLSTETFTFHREGNQLIAEASTLGDSFRLARLWDDACDQGITLKSHRTGREITYVLTGEERYEGELQGWRMAPADAELAAMPEVLILND